MSGHLEPVQEYFRAVYERYHQAGREAKHFMLNEFCLNTGYNRKYAIRLLNGPPPGKQPERRRRPHYGPQVLSILAAIWEAAGYPWSVRLKALPPSWMPWIRKRYRMTPPMEKQLLGISARQIDRKALGKTVSNCSNLKFRVSCEGEQLWRGCPDLNYDSGLFSGLLRDGWGDALELLARRTSAR